MSAELPSAVSDLTRADHRSPAAQDDVRAPRREGSVRAYYRDLIRFPGYGTQPDRCRVLKPVGFCAGHGHVQIASAQPCGTRRCPVHWRDWRREAVKNLLVRLAAYRYAQDGGRRRLLHVMASPDQDKWWTADSFWRARSASYDPVKAVGGRGGVVVPHPYRSSEDGDHLFQTVVESGDWEEEDGKWSLFREVADDWEEMGQFLEAGPHYHMLVPCEDFDPAGVPSGWVVENIRSFSRFHIRDEESYRDMVRTAMYLLSHAAYQSGKNTVTYWGEVHPNAFKPEEELSEREYRVIEEMAERVIGVDCDGSGSGTDQPTCSREKCESVVVPLDELRDRLDDSEWLDSIRVEQRFRLFGVKAWLLMGGDRPPPSARSREQAMLDWLQERGKVYFREHQVSFDRFAGGAPHLVDS